MDRQKNKSFPVFGKAVIIIGAYSSAALKDAQLRQTLDYRQLPREVSAC
jgi:hypothetical protein